MRLPLVSSALVVCQLGLAAAGLDHAMIQRSLEARTWAHETRSDLGDLSGMLETCDGCKVSHFSCSPFLSSPLLSSLVLPPLPT